MVTKNGRLSRLSLALLALIVLLMTACIQAAPTVSKPTLSSDPVVRWIQQNAISLRTTNQGGSDDDLAPLKQIVGQASIVGLGEDTHGGHEIIDIKARVAEYLISHLGYTTFVLENDWGVSQLLDAYINGGAGSLDALMSQSLSSVWQTQEYAQLFTWMRTYNANPAHTAKIHFLGMDCANVTQSDFDAVEQYMRTVDPSQVASVENLYAPIIANDRSSGPYLASLSYEALSASTKQQFQNQAQQVYNLLQAHQQDFTGRSSAQSFAVALQNARIIVQFTMLNDYATQDEYLTDFYQRDNFMAENVAWIHDHDAGSNPKIIVWAHDRHIANNISYPSPDGRNMGGDLRARYQANYLPIGTSLYRGIVRGYASTNTPVGSMGKTVQTPDTDTYNYMFGQAGFSLYMLDLRTIPAGPVYNWFEGSGNFFLAYGDDGSTQTTLCAINQWFDVIIHIQNVTPSQSL